MKLLLDTHIWLWSVLDPERLSRRVAKALEDEENELWLSPVSVWELSLLQRKGRLKILDVPAWVAATVRDLRLTEAPLTIEVALAMRLMKFPHGDPADHFLAASAKVFNLTLVTADERLIRSAVVPILANH